MEPGRYSQRKTAFPRRERMLKSKASDAERIEVAFLRLSGRGPDAKESAILLQTLKEQTKQFNASPAGAKKLIAIGDSKPDPTLDPVELAAMTVTIQMILNSDAVIWKR